MERRNTRKKMCQLRTDESDHTKATNVLHQKVFHYWERSCLTCCPCPFLVQCFCIPRHLGQVRGHWSATTRRMRTSTCQGPMWRSRGWTQTSRGSRWWLQIRKIAGHFSFDWWLATFSWLAILFTSAFSFNHVDINYLLSILLYLYPASRLFSSLTCILQLMNKYELCSAEWN